ncbi:shikimate kinase [Microbacterium sp. No. 7]|uniref:shikimate kinase n=1 Tax=Microbacterium sp. No. 7 TaxID=1714373 RepID=UPI0006D13FE3|nr:shikimate kinase [Microbacterium sp. No. 7]ALJ20165.1 shikimate kinase [Microbacterium sp. No. 7]
MTALVLIGPMGAGKSSVGRRVAKALDVPFVDTDAAVVRDHGPIDALFATHGEAHFRRLERAAVASALAGEGVVALGGGAVLDTDTQRDLADHRVVLLTVSPERVASRIRGTSRPLLDDPDPVQRWRDVYAARRETYERLADLTVDTSTGPLQHVVDRVVAWAAETGTAETADPAATAEGEMP